MTEGHITQKRYDHVSDYFANVFPGIAPDKLGVFGETMRRQTDIFQEWMPYSMSRQTDLVENELLKLEIYPGMPNQTVKLPGRYGEYYLDADLYDEFLAEYGPLLKSRMAQLISRPNWNQRSVEARRRVLDSLSRKLRDRIKNKYTREQFRRLREQGKLPALLARQAQK